MNHPLINIKELIKGISIICSYFILGSILSISFSFFKNIQLEFILPYLFLAIIFVIIYFKELKKDFKSFKKNYKSILITTLKFWLIGLLIMIISSNIISAFDIAPVQNQEQNKILFKTIPFAECFVAIILAPIIEEIVFRKSLKKFTTNKHLFALSTGLIFSFIHVISSISSLNSYIMLIYMIPYSALGIAFGYSYAKTDNIYGTMIFHAIHNAISLILLII